MGTPAGQGMHRTVPADGCAPVVVRVERAGEHIRLWIVDGDGRRGERSVRDLATAVAIVESWTLHEIAAPVAPAVEAARRAEPTPAASVAIEPVASAVPRWGIGVGFASAYGADGSAWLGASVSGCVRVGPLCLGALLRAASDGSDSADASFEPMPGTGHAGVEELANTRRKGPGQSRHKLQRF